MLPTHALAAAFMDALRANDAALYEIALAPNAGLRVWNTQGLAICRPRARVIDYLMRDGSARRDPVLEQLSLVADSARIAVEFRIQATEQGRYIEHNRVAMLTLQDAQIAYIDLYCPAPIPSARRKNWIAPANLDDAQMLDLFETWQASFDVREMVPMNSSSEGGLDDWMGGTGDAHPGSNFVDGTRWSAEQADANIARVIDYHRQHQIGFHWLVNPCDRPVDLRERLERHGLMLAGDQALMACVDLNDLAIPINPQVEIEIIDGTNDQSIEDRLRIVATCFNWTPAQIDARRPNFFERLKNPKIRETEVGLLARLNGQAVADARVIFNAGMAYLGGASTLPQYRGQKIYSTLLRRRLEIARERGYHVAAIHAEPMSRRIVSKYGFKEYGRAYLYGWMPVMDATVIKSLVPDD